MKLALSAIELRLLGCLIEKAIITPDQYPLSLNALTNAANQKSSREPVMSLSETDVRNGLIALQGKHLVRDLTQGSRVVKYKHRFCNTEFSDFQFDAQELGILCLLFLRGPQTPGELRSRSGRLCDFIDAHETESVIKKLQQHNQGPLVVELPRETGKRESRFTHLFVDNAEELIEQEKKLPEPADPPTKSPSANNRSDANPKFKAAKGSPVQRLEVLETAVAELTKNIELIKSELGIN